MMKSVQWITKPNKHLWVAIEPFLHPNTASIAIQKSLSSTPTVAQLEWKRGFSCILWVSGRLQDQKTTADNKTCNTSDNTHSKNTKSV